MPRGPLGDRGIRGDLYWLGLDRDERHFNGTSGHEKRQTLGARLFGALPGTPLDFEVEGAYQLGEVGPGDVNAFMVASQLGWWLEDAPDLAALLRRLRLGERRREPGRRRRDLQPALPALAPVLRLHRRDRAPERGRRADGSRAASLAGHHRHPHRTFLLARGKRRRALQRVGRRDPSRLVRQPQLARRRDRSARALPARRAHRAAGGLQPLLHGQTSSERPDAGGTSTSAISSSSTSSEGSMRKAPA